MFKYTISIKTPDVTSDVDYSYQLDLADKRQLHLVERSLHKALGRLLDMTGTELLTGKKLFTKNDPQTLVIETSILENGEDFGGAMFRWPNQSDDAREAIRDIVYQLVGEANTEFGAGLDRKIRAKNR